MLRQPIVTILGHVDHGKTTLLDTIRGSAIASREAGGITQAIGASIIPLQTLRSICGTLLDTIKLQLTIPGLLFIDTPGHAAFVSLRKRGGNLADIAILVIDANEGFMPQTRECIEILKSYKTPFIVALNKIDITQGWRSKAAPSLIGTLNAQQPNVQQLLETKLYTVVGNLYEMGIQADRFDRVSDYTKQVAVVPVSAATGDGIPELLMVLTGLAQRFLEKDLEIKQSGPAKGTILEVKEVTGLGTALDVILYDGELDVGDGIVIGGIDAPITTKVKALFEPAPLAEMREKKTRFVSVKTVHAATGVRIVATGVETAVAGMPLIEANKPDETEDAKAQVQSEVAEVIKFESAADGIVVKADTLGSLEALTMLLREHSIPVKRASIGAITKKDLAEAESFGQSDPLRGVVLGFNVPAPEGIPFSVTAFCNTIIYKLIEDYQAWIVAQQKKVQMGELDKLPKPCRVEVLRGYVFRQSNPAVVGVEVHAGELKSNTLLMNKQGQPVAVVKGIQLNQENILSAKRGSRIAASLPDGVVGKNIHEGETLWSAISEEEFRKYKDYKQYLTAEDKELLKEIAAMMRETNPVWGI